MNRILLEEPTEWKTKNGNRIPITGKDITKYVTIKEASKLVDKYYSTHKKGGSCEEVADLVEKTYKLPKVEGQLIQNKNDGFNTVQSHFVNKGYAKRISDFSSPTQYGTSKEKIIQYRHIKDNIYANKKIYFKNESEIYKLVLEDKDLVVFMLKEE